MIILITAAAFLATLSGGLLSLHFKDRLHLILGFSAGAVIGVAFFDLIPEALEIGSSVYSSTFITGVMAFGFMGYLILDRMILLHGHREESYGERRGILGAASLSFHSFLDGVGIGLAFQVSPVLGLIVAAAVLTHDFSDGVNTVNVVLKNNGDRRTAFTWLLVDACAPVAGVISTLFFTLSEASLGLLLALFSGFFLYIGASDLLPESHHAHPVKWTTFMTILGMLTLYAIVRLASL